MPLALIDGRTFVLCGCITRARAADPDLHSREIRSCAARSIANAFGWGSIVGLNVLLPIYLQRVMGLSPTNAGLSLMVFMVALNISAGLAGQVLGRVRHYKRLPMIALTVAIGAVTILGLARQ